jgi:hypothetical protein
VNVVLKSGGNQVHGSLFEFQHNDRLNTRNLFLDHLKTNRRKSSAIQRVRLPLPCAHRRAAESAFHPGKLQAGRRRTAFHWPARPPFSACMIHPAPHIMRPGAGHLHHTFSGAVPCPAGAACLNLTPRLNFTQTLNVREPGFRHATRPHRQETKPAQNRVLPAPCSICGVASRSYGSQGRTLNLWTARFWARRFSVSTNMEKLMAKYTYPFEIC